MSWYSWLREFVADAAAVGGREPVFVVEDSGESAHLLTEQDEEPIKRLEVVAFDLLVHLVVLLCRSKELPVVLVNEILLFLGWSHVVEKHTNQFVMGDWMNCRYLSVPIQFQESEENESYDDDRALRMILNDTQSYSTERGRLTMALVEDLIDGKHRGKDLTSKQQPLSDPSQVHQWFTLKCVLLEVDCVSHDQGWASENPELNNTYRESHTWAELEIKKTGRAQQQQQQHHWGLGDDDHKHSTGKWPASYGRVHVINNIRANDTFRHHRRYFTDPVLLKDLQFGDEVHLFVRAQNPGWCIYVKHARLRAFFTFQVKEEFDVTSAQVIKLYHSIAQKYLRKDFATGSKRSDWRDNHDDADEPNKKKSCG